MIYLDHAATTPLSPMVLEAMLPYLTTQFGNPSSLHKAGYAARQAIQQAQQLLATLFETMPDEWLFTSGATEANNLVLQGLAGQFNSPGHLIVSAIEHAAVLAPVERLAQQGWCVTLLPVTSEGIVTPDILKAALRPDTRLVSMMHGNNEIGTIQDIAALSAITKAHGALFHTDAVQTAGKLPISLKAWAGVDYLSVSAHKCYGPKGSGALFMRSSAPKPCGQIIGGGQQQELRAGTENVAGIVGLAAALAQCSQHMASGGLAQSRRLQAAWRDAMTTAFPKAVWNGPWEPEERVPGNLHWSFAGLQGESLVNQLDLQGYCVSSGSACHSQDLQPSHVVMALGNETAMARGTLRLSLGQANTEADIEPFVNALGKVLKRVKWSGLSETTE